MTIPAFVISLEQDHERFAQFRHHNAHLDYTVFKAIRGAEISHDERIASGLVTAECLAKHRISDGTIGCAASHRELWDIAAQSDSGCLILEDDVITHPSLAAFLASVVPAAPGIDLIRFAINTNSVLVAEDPQGLRHMTLFDKLHPDPSWIGAALVRTPIAEVRLWRLLRCFGQAAYFVSPAGARKLLKAALPLRSAGVAIPLVSKNMPGVSTDRRLNALYGQLDARVTLPFLAWTPNTDSATAAS